MRPTLRASITLDERARAEQRVSQGCSRCNRVHWHHAKDLNTHANDGQTTLPELEPRAQCPACREIGGQALHPVDGTPAEAIDGHKIVLCACRRCGARRRMHPVRLVYGAPEAREQSLLQRTREMARCPRWQCRARDRHIEIEVLDAVLALDLADEEDSRRAEHGDEIHLIAVAPPHGTIDVALDATGLDPHCRRLGMNDELYRLLKGRAMDEEIAWAAQGAAERWLIAWIGRAAGAPR